MSHSRRRPREHILLGGEAQDLPAICEALDRLPDTAYGQVFIEAVMPEDVRTVTAPARVTVSWLIRSGQRSRVPSLIFADRGELLAQALELWAGEWLIDDGGAPALEHMWIGCSTSPWLEATRAAIADRDSLPTPDLPDERFASH